MHPHFCNAGYVMHVLYIYGLMIGTTLIFEKKDI